MPVVNIGNHLCMALLAMLLSACSSLSGQSAPSNDPLEGFNRSMFAFNEKLSVGDSAKQRGMHHPLTLISNVFSNLGEVPDTVNHLLQGNPRDALDDSVRFTFNSTFGFAGIFDVASEMGIQKKDEDFGQTLGKWGVGTGSYLVLPFIGPTTVRDVAAMPVDGVLDPLTYTEHDRAFKLTRAVVGPDKSSVPQAREQNPAADAYTLQRDTWLKYREAQIND